MPIKESILVSNWIMKKYRFIHIALLSLLVLLSFVSCQGNKTGIGEKTKNNEINKVKEVSQENTNDHKSFFSADTFSPFMLSWKYGLLDKNLNIQMDPNYLTVKVYDYCVVRKTINNEYTVYDSKLNELYNSPNISFVDIVSEKYCQLWIKDQLNSYVLLNLFDGESKIFNDYDRLVPDNLENEKYYASSSLSAFVNKDFTTEAFPSIRFGGGGYPFREGKAVVYCYNYIYDPPYSVINEKGEQIITGISEVGKYFTEGLLPVIMQDGKSGYIDENGKFEIDCDFNVFYKGPKDGPRLEYLFYDGIAVVNKKEEGKYQWFLLDRTKTFTKINEKYEPLGYEFKEGYLVLKTTDKENVKYIFINKKAEQVFNTTFDYADNFVNGYAVVVYNDEDAILDKEGNIYLSKDLLNGSKKPFVNLMKK